MDKQISKLKSGQQKVGLFQALLRISTNLVYPRITSNVKIENKKHLKTVQWGRRAIKYPRPSCSYIYIDISKLGVTSQTVEKEAPTQTAFNGFHPWALTQAEDTRAPQVMYGIIKNSNICLDSCEHLRISHDRRKHFILCLVVKAFNSR